MLFKKTKEFNNWIYILVKEGMIKDIESAERMSIWKICDILDYLALENDKQNEYIQKQKNKKN